MNILTSQFLEVKKHFPNVTKENCKILCEGGSEVNGTYKGSFVVKIARRGVYRFDNGTMTRKIS